MKIITNYANAGEMCKSQDYPSLLLALSDCRVIAIERIENNIILTECCDHYYQVKLTKEQFLLWIDELKTLIKE